MSDQPISRSEASKVFMTQAAALRDKFQNGTIYQVATNPQALGPEDKHAIHGMVQATNTVIDNVTVGLNNGILIAPTTPTPPTLGDNRATIDTIDYDDVRRTVGVLRTEMDNLELQLGVHTADHLQPGYQRDALVTEIDRMRNITRTDESPLVAPPAHLPPTPAAPAPYRASTPQVSTTGDTRTEGNPVAAPAPTPAAPTPAVAPATADPIQAAARAFMRRPAPASIDTDSTGVLKDSYVKNNNKESLIGKIGGLGDDINSEDLKNIQSKNPDKRNDPDR
jgi:hypothetical protein